MPARSKLANLAETDLPTYFFLAVFAFLLYQMARLASPFLTALLGAAILSLAFYPLHARLAKRLPLDETWAAALSTLLILLIVVLPAIGLGWLLLREADALGPSVQSVLADLRALDIPAAADALPWPIRSPVRGLVGLLGSLGVDLNSVILAKTDDFEAAITAYGAQTVKGIFFLLFNLAVMTLTLFYALRDGPRLLRWSLQLVPMPQVHKSRLAERIYQTFEAVVVGALVTAVAQGALATPGFWLAGLRTPFLLGTATALFALFPGTFLITLPTSFYVYTYDRGHGLFLILWSLAIVGFSDNIMKSALIGSRARLPFFVLFFAILGAVRVYGLFGLVLGPILVTIVLAFVDIYRQEFFSPASG